MTLRSVFVGASVMVLLTALLGSESLCDLPGSEVSLPEYEVKDRFYSYLIGLVERDTCGVLDADQIGEVLAEYRGKTSIPFEKIKEIERECRSSTQGREVSIEFEGNLKTPVPYSILGYHPGSVMASTKVRFLEWKIPRKTLRWSKTESIDLSQVYVFGVCDGWAVVDIDAWLDKILGGLLDDTRIVVLVLFKYKGGWHALAAGYGPSGEGRSGVFDFRSNKILFPTPRELRMLGPYFRNFVTRTKRLDVPMPPDEKWCPTG